jgi:hypothetical protein
MRKKRCLKDEYRFPGFYPKSGVQGIFGDPKARVIQLNRRQKKLGAVLVGLSTGVSTIEKHGGFGIYLAEIHGSIWNWRFDGFYAGGAGR